MTAVNSIPPTATPDRDQRPYEPSMEEILASIRRIIADDQSLPGRQDPAAPVEPPPVETHAPKPEPTTVHVLRPVPAAEAAPAPNEKDMHEDDETMHAPAPSSFVAHGQIAPQFATPEGPVVPVREPDPAAPIETGTAFDDDHLDAQTGHQITGDHATQDDDFHQAYDSDPAPQPDVTSIYDEPLGRHEPTPFEPEQVDPIPLFSAATGQSITSAFNTLAASRLADNSDELLSMSREMIRPLLKTWLDENLPSMVERLVRAEIERVARGGR